MYLPGTLPDLTHRLREIKPPVHVIWGEKDLTLDPRSFPKMVAAMHGARGDAIKNCGHQPHISKPREVLDLTLKFLATLQGNSRLTRPQFTNHPKSFPHQHQAGR
jgi:pimeloyl-ACP methyl ester carboxylesterase